MKAEPMPKRDSDDELKITAAELEDPTRAILRKVSHVKLDVEEIKAALHGTSTSAGWFERVRNLERKFSIRERLEWIIIPLFVAVMFGLAVKAAYREVQAQAAPTPQGRTIEPPNS